MVKPAPDTGSAILGRRENLQLAGFILVAVVFGVSLGGIFYLDHLHRASQPSFPTAVQKVQP